VDGYDEGRHHGAPMEFDFCRVCGQTNPLERPACAMCGRISWRPVAASGSGLVGAMERVELAVGRARGVRETAESLRTRRSA
jgi:hypothetical protein